MSNVEIPELARKLLVFGGKRLNDSVPTEVLSLSREVGTTAKSGAVTAVFGASVAAAIHLYNDARDRDEDGVLGAARARADAAQATTAWRPQLPFAPGSAWLKYSLGAEVTARASGSIGVAGGSVSGDRSLRLLSYKRHDAADTIGSSIAADLLEISSPLSVADILALAPQEATALKIRGKLSARLTLSWADIFSTSLHELSDLFGADGGAFLIEVAGSANVSFTATIDDDFTLCFVREKASGERPIRVALRKSISHDQRFLAKAGVRVEFADPSAVKAVVDNVLGGVLGMPAAALKAIERAPSLKSVPEKYRALVAALAERFGIEDLDPLQPIKIKLRQLDALLNDRIDRLARTKVTLGLQYEYLRIASEASLLEATVSEAALGRLHAALLAFDFATVLDDAGPGLALDFFLHQKTVDRVRAWGFSLGIGTWLKLAGKQTRRDLFVSRRYVSADGEQLTQAYLGSTLYTAKANTWSAEYGAMLKADLEEARAPQETMARDFKCGLHLWWEENKLRADSGLPRIVDDAVLWGVIGAAGAPALHAQLSVKLDKVHACRVRLSAMLSDHGLRQAVRSLAGVSDEECGRHAARALPWYGKQTARATCASREAAYSPFFSRYAQAPDLRGSGLKQLVAESLRDLGGGLAGQEAKGETPWTLYQVLLRANIEDQRFWKRWKDLRAGASRLAELLELRGDWGDFDDNFKLMSRSFEQVFLIRAVASLLAQLLPAVVHDPRAYTTTLTLSHGAPGREKVIVVAGKA